VGPVPVVVVDEDAKHLFELSSVEDEKPVEALRACVRTKRSAIAFAFGARTGVRMNAARLYSWMSPPSRSENRISAPHTSLTPLLTLLSVTSSIPREQRLARVVIGE
jgi:hypothetical protein